MNILYLNWVRPVNNVNISRPNISQFTCRQLIDWIHVTMVTAVPYRASDYVKNQTIHVTKTTMGSCWPGAELDSIYRREVQSMQSRMDFDY